MKRTSLLTGILACTGLLLLILDSKTALAGAMDGLDLCIKTIIPSLFPFFFLTILLTNSLTDCSLPVMKPIIKFTHSPAGTETILLAGFLGGYPAGAQCIHTAYSSGHLSKDEAHRMLSFCNNAGPAFLFGIIHNMFDTTSAAFALWGIHVISALLTANLCPPSMHCPSRKSDFDQKPSDVMRSALYTMAAVCGWVILFRIIITFLDTWILWMFPATIRVVITGILELSNGCCSLREITDPELRFIICACLLSLGGLCVAMQTHAVTSGLSMKPYLKGKLLQTCFSLLLSVFIMNNCLPAIFVIILFTWTLQKMRKNKSRNSAAAAV